MKEKHCLACFEKIRKNSFFSLFMEEKILCDNCLSERRFVFEREEIEGLKILSLFKHEEPTSQWLYQYKTLKDYEMRKAFLTPFENLFRMFSFFYKIIPLPSTEERIRERGFNHLIEILKVAKIPYLDILRKTDGPDQKDLNFEERKKVGKRIKILDKKNIEGKRILLFDDVTTTGSSLLAARDLIQKENPKSIQAIVLMRHHL